MIRWKKSTTSESLASLQEIRPLIKQLQQDSQAKQHQLYHSILESNFPDYFHPLAEFFETEIKKWLTTNDKSPGNYLWPLRVALSGASKSPSPFELLSVLTPEQADERINQVLSQKNTES
jgi:glutamyl/glutaminyl-tRNA synthetase